MASGTFYPAVSGDDGFWSSGYFGSININGYFGDSGGVSHNSFVRFSNITIPKGSAITNAFIRFKAYAGRSSVTTNVNIYFNDVDNATAPTTEGGANSLALTGATAWNNISATTTGVAFDTPDIAGILQGIIHRAGWNSGNALQIILKDNSSSNNAVRDNRSYDYGSDYPELHVTWTPAVYGDINVTNPSMAVQGYTGIQAVCSLPMIQTEGYTGIYTAPSIPMSQVEGFTGIYSAPSIPMIRANATLSDNMIHVESSLIIPSMTAEATQADQIWGNVTIPMMTAEITERETVLGNVTVPMITVELASGIHADIEVTAPMMTTEGTFSNQCEVTLPMMTVEVEGIVGRVINSDIRLPMVTVEMTGKTEHLIDCDVSVPKMRVVADLMTGKIITGAATIPMMEAALTSYEDITGDIDAFVPMMEAYMVATAERAECAVLRYLEPSL